MTCVCSLFNVRQFSVVENVNSELQYFEDSFLNPSSSQDVSIDLNFSEHNYCIPVNNSLLDIAFVNVGGLCSKLYFIPEFEDFINKHSIVCLAEPKLDSFDKLEVDGYTFKGINRVHCKRKSGGVGAFIKNNLINQFVMLDISHENCFWFTFKDSNIVFAVTYIPPEGSQYSSIEIFDKIENNIIDVNAQFVDHSIIMLGDYNSRTSLLSDFVDIDRYISDAILDNDPAHTLSRNNLCDLGIPLDRYSNDANFINNYGIRLVDLCRSTGLLIANGRCGNDMYIGKNTCKSASLVDYVIMSPCLFPCIRNFTVHDFDPLFSDSHSCLTFDICTQNNLCSEEDVTIDIKDNSFVNVPSWDNSVRDKFTECFNNPSILQMNNDLSKIYSDKTYSSECINTITEKVSLFLSDVADKCKLLSKKQYSCHKPKKTRKEWFDNDCKFARQQYHTSKNRHRKLRNAESFNDMVNNSKVYKKLLNSKVRTFQNNVNKKLKNLRSSDPKSFWSLLNKYTGQRKETLSKITSEVFYEHFLNLNQSVDNNDDNFHDLDFETLASNNDTLNEPFTVNEIKKSILNLKNNKTPSLFDNVLNEYLKYCNSEDFMLVICKLFNIILDSGIFPEVWSKGIILPIYKNKGSTNDPDNYRGITILSCFGKLFTSVLNNRLNLFLENNNILCEEQAGFRKGYSTIDHIFSLKLIIDFYLAKKKNLFCAFIDYKKAFDSVNRLALWRKLLSNNIDGKCLKIIYNMYSSAKSCVKVGNTLSGFFTSHAGVRQGENLSPVLFSLFLNDLTMFMSTRFEGLETLSRSTFDMLSNEDVDVYLRIFILLYADDTVILAESQVELQNALYAMYDYCNLWGLKVNAAKTKVVIFSKCKINKNRFEFFYDNVKLDIVDDFSYLGAQFKFNGNFSKTKKHLVDQARKAMFAVVTKSRKLNLPFSLQLHLFDSLVTPILLYGSEVWAFENLNIIQSFQLKFCKFILTLKSPTPNCMIFGELGIKPIVIQAKTRLLCYWSKLLNCKDSKICNIVYRTAYKLHSNNIVEFPWISCVKKCLDDLGMSEYFINQKVDNIDHFKMLIKIRLSDQFLQNWNSTLYNSAKCLVYRCYKTEHCFEGYLDSLPRNLAIYMCKFRTMNHSFPIEKGRYTNIDRADRICNLCRKNTIGDEFHYLFECTHFSIDRRKYIQQYYIRHPNSYKLKELMNCNDRAKLIKLALFCKILLTKIK